jgi:hypothetical protein
MPRYIVERTFASCVGPPIAGRGAQMRADIVRRNHELGVTWLHSYVSVDHEKTFCVYDAPSAEAIHASAAANDLPVERITRVQVLDPYHYAWPAHSDGEGADGRRPALKP